MFELQRVVHVIAFLFALQDAKSKYNVKVKDGVEQYNQTIEIDPEKKTEKVHIPSTSSSPGEIDIVYDFEKVKHRGEVRMSGLQSLNR